MKVVLGNGEDITPGGALRQAILAILLVAPSQTRARRTLQDMFWGSDEPEKSSGRFRTALNLLKRDLALLGKDCIRADRHSVSLAPGRIAVANDSFGPSFLEGMDLRRLTDCEGFEDWLRQMRAGGDERYTGDGEGHELARTPEPTRQHTALGLLAPHHAGLVEDDLNRIESFLDAIARFVSLMTDIEIHDLRDCADFTFPLPIDTGLGATHLLQPVVERRGQTLALHLRLYEATDRRVVWMSEPIDLRADHRNAVVCSLSEMLLQQMVACPARGDPRDLFPWTALTGLFSLDDDLISRTEAKVWTLADNGHRPVFECLRVFTQIFKENEGLARADATSAEEICETLSAIPDTHPLLPLALSLSGYSAHMLVGDNDLAEMLVTRSRNLAPNLALNLDHLAVIRLMRGDLAGAERALDRCLRCGAASPWRYTYNVSGAMIAIARGDVRQALLFSNRALMLKPRFIGALRYAMLGFALSEQAREADRMKARIQRLRPGYDFNGWTLGLMGRSQPHFSKTLAKGLKTTHLI
ncbi:tetratricopeptide repeat protein [Meridianimarinicoccus sp. MJW13]|uniref:tetratricopeptide repeat protein n=1 Tax=Meridianimarinicoccus sp. MJW13 TaxID=2720031 RepID=UPI001868238D|nr:tetratricopeptide repeat protein [Fluviibacterium sp. MJW13]